MLAVFVGGIEIDTAVCTVPLQERHRRIEVARDGRYLLSSQVHQESLRVEVVGNGMRTAVLADATEGLGTADQH